MANKTTYGNTLKTKLGVMSTTQHSQFTASVLRTLPVLRPKIKLLLDVSAAKNSLGSNSSEGEKQLVALIPNEEHDKSKIDGIVDGLECLTICGWVVADGMTECLFLTSWPYCVCIENLTSVKAKC